MVTIRRYSDTDKPAVLALLQASLGWVPDAQYQAFYEWKHDANPFGTSLRWVAEEGGCIVGFRAFLRWEFTNGTRTYRAVRAVDTATHPDWQGKGIFRQLTLHGLDELADDGVDFVFNTPNEKSRPGYLKMGWEVLGRPSVGVRPRSAGATMGLMRSRVPAEKWSLEPATSVADGLDELAVEADSNHSAGIRTRRTAEFLQWRYGMPALQYRICRTDDGTGVFRLRQRGGSVEADLCHHVGTSKAAAGLARRIMHDEDQADYVITVGRPRGFLPVPRSGPVVTVRPVACDALPSLESWAFSLGDLELM